MSFGEGVTRILKLCDCTLELMKTIADLDPVAHALGEPS